MNAANQIEHEHVIPKIGPKVHDLSSLLDRVEQLTYINGEVCLKDIITVIGTRWFGPLLMVPGLVMVVPGVGDIPGMSALMGLVVLIISVQAIFDRSSVWLPQWVATRNVSEAKVKRAIKWLRRPAAFIDNHTRRRLTWAVRHASIYVIAATCIVLAAMTPLLELIPGSGILVGAAITNFGLSLLAHDGLIAILAITFSLGTIGVFLSKFVI